ncbi:ethanolamine utilization protein EutH [Shigella sonnei]|nr:ethanolamine utilization protein EutH [Shigella sonnei]
MGINEIIMYIMMFFMLIAAVDRILSQFGGSARFLGKFGKSIEGSGGQFEEGFMAMGALGLAMVGMTALAPVLAHVLGPVIIPVYEMLGANPSMFAGTLLACDVRYGRLLPRQRAGGRRRSSVAILWVNSWVDDGANDCVFHSGGARHYRTF